MNRPPAYTLHGKAFVTRLLVAVLCCWVVSTSFVPHAWAVSLAEPAESAGGVPVASAADAGISGANAATRVEVGSTADVEGAEEGADGLGAQSAVPARDANPSANAATEDGALVVNDTAEGSASVVSGTAEDAQAVSGTALEDSTPAANSTTVESTTPAVNSTAADTNPTAVDSGQIPAEGTQNASNGAENESAAQAANALAASYDARTEGFITPVRMQEPWGACWAFGSLAAMEANLVKQGLITSNDQLSPRHLIYFAGTPVGSEAGAQAGEGQYPISSIVELYGENAVFEMGGHALEAASAISSGEGVALEADYPYQNNEGYVVASGMNYSKDGTWALPESSRYTAAFGLRNMIRITNPATYSEPGNINSFALNYYALDAVKQAILDYGAVSVSYCSYHGEGGQPNYYDMHNSTYFTNATTVVDHDVCIVGWDDNFEAERFTTGKDGILPEGNGAWIVKNSWGAEFEEFPNKNNWGNEGYFYLSYFDRSAQGFTAWDMMPLTSPDWTTITNQYDYMGQRSNAETRVVDYAPVSYANVFSAEQDQTLRAVSVNTYAPNTEVVIQVYDVDSAAEPSSANPTTGKLLATQSLLVDWGGYHRIMLQSPQVLSKGQRFAVVVSALEATAEGTKIPVASIEAGNNSASVDVYKLTHGDRVIVNAGETRVLADLDENPATPSTWVDGAEYATLLQARATDGAYYGNACIKAFSDPYEAPVVPDEGDKPAPAPSPAPAPQPSPAPAPAPNEEGAGAAVRPEGSSQGVLPVNGGAQTLPAAQTAVHAPAHAVKATAAPLSPKTADETPLGISLLLIISLACMAVARSKQTQGF